ncbi:MAG: HAD family hydrolase [Chitinispirillales bacterium]|nr:HAD family hydrolase [Chitinispirillales bacterium]
MPNLAEYAQQLHEKKRREYPRKLIPRKLKGKFQQLKGMRAVVFDVYGTLVNYWRPGFEDRPCREDLLLQAFSEISAMFEMDGTLTKMNPADPPARTLNDFYNGLIALNHQKSVGEGIEFPEVRLDEVWSVIVMMLKRNGYDAEARFPGGAAASASTMAAEFARYLAYTYNFLSMGRTLYPEVASALKKMKGGNITLGILSDAQLYTPIDLTLLLREQSGGTIDDYNEMFDADLTFFSYQYGYVKPSDILFRKLFDALYEYHITPAQTVFVGNDLATDIKPAAALGMRTALFCGDGVMVFGDAGDVVPDIVFEDWDELPELISFHGEMD